MPGDSQAACSTFSPFHKPVAIVQGCLEWDPEKRMTAEAALQHPWITQAEVPMTPCSARGGSSIWTPRKQSSSWLTVSSWHTSVN